MRTTEKTTAPVPCGLTWEAYCEALGVDAADARQASVVRALRDKLERDTKSAQAALDHAALECQTDR